MPLSIRFCPTCGLAVEPHYKFCVDCGTNLVSVDDRLSRREQFIATTTSVDPEPSGTPLQRKPEPTANPVSANQFVARFAQFWDRLQQWPPDVQPPQFFSTPRNFNVLSRQFNFSIGLLLEILVVVILTAIAGWMRTSGLADLSPGINIDESTYAAEIHRIVDGEWIGKFSGASLGVPTLQFYVTAPLFMLFDSELWAIRIVSAVAGTMIVPFTFILIRRFFPFTVAFVTAVLAAFSIYLMLESRIGWPLMLAIFELLAALTLLVFSIDRRMPWLAIIAGVVLGAGMYTHQVFLPYWASCIGIATIVALFHPKLRHRRELYLFAVVGFLTGINMAWFLLFQFDFVADLENHYGAPATIDFVRWARRAWEVFMFFRSPISADFTDAAPSAPILTGVLQVLFIVGLAVSALRIRDYRYQILVIGLLIGMSPTVLVPGSEARRFVIGMLFMFAFTGVGINTLLQLIGSQLGSLFSTSNTRGIAVARNIGFLVAISVFVATTAISGYQRLDQWRSQDARWTFNYDLTRLAEYIKNFDDGYTVHFYSDRGGAPHPIIDWVAPHLVIVDGKEERVDGQRVLRVDAGENDPAAIALLESYMEHATELQEIYPDATLIELRDENDRDTWKLLVIRAP